MWEMIGSAKARTEEGTRTPESGRYGKRLRISVIIPVRPGGSAEKAIEALRSVEYPPECLEVLVAEGTQPARQRNAAAHAAGGDILYFLDNDSEADIDLFRFVARGFADPDVAIVGGPSEILPSDSLLQKCFGFVLSSYFAVASVRCRYKSIGRWPQRSTEHKLILCNLGIRTEVFREEGGFDERMYPNEENELLNRLYAMGYVLVYNPRAVVRRPHRTSLGEFVRQMFSYGRGRMHHFRLHPHFINPLYLMPVALLAYLVSLPVAFAMDLSTDALRWYLVPAGVYAFASALSTGRIVVDEEDWRPAFVVPLLFLLVHLSYALGMFSGILHRQADTIGNRIPGIVGQTVKVAVVKAFGVPYWSDLRNGGG